MSERGVRPWVLVGGHRPMYTAQMCDMAADGCRSPTGYSATVQAAFENLLLKVTHTEPTDSQPASQEPVLTVGWGMSVWVWVSVLGPIEEEQYGVDMYFAGKEETTHPPTRSSSPPPPPCVRSSMCPIIIYSLLTCLCLVRLAGLPAVVGHRCCCSGHVHAYERHWPVFSGLAYRSYDDPPFPVHVISGAAGNIEGLSRWVIPVLLPVSMGLTHCVTHPVRARS